MTCSITYSDHLPILDLGIFHDQLVLGVADNDKIYLSRLLNNAVNVKNYIQLYAPGEPKALNLLFNCLAVLHEYEKEQECISSILCLMYVHFYHQLNQEKKNFIRFYTGLNDFQLMTLIQPVYSPLYFSDGIKRQRFEPDQDANENDFQDLYRELAKKHELDSSEPTSLAKRQKLKSPSRPDKREAPLGDDAQMEQASKRNRRTR